MHNLRSALDAMAYGLAVLNLGPLREVQEKATFYPIFEEEARFDALLNRPVARGQSVTIRDLYR